MYSASSETSDQARAIDQLCYRCGDCAVELKAGRALVDCEDGCRFAVEQDGKTTERRLGQSHLH